MDIQMVSSECGAAMYVCMYASKSEPERPKYALNETLQNLMLHSVNVYPW